jgi:hypothetical protein
LAGSALAKSDEGSGVRGSYFDVERQPARGVDPADPSVIKCRQMARIACSKQQTSSKVNR